MRRKKKLAKTDSGQIARKPKQNIGRYLIAGTLMLAVSLSPKLKAQDFKWEKCECGEVKSVQCGNAVYKGSKKTYDSKKGEYECFCPACPSQKKEAKPVPEEDFDLESYLNGLAKKEVEKKDGAEHEIKKENTYKKLPSVDVVITSDKKGFMEKWLELELKIIEKADESVLDENGFSTTDYYSIKSKSTAKLKKIESTILKTLKLKGLEKPENEKEIREFFEVLNDVILNDLGIEYSPGLILSKGLIENKLDCDSMSAIILQIADSLELPVRVVVTLGSNSVGHAFLAWELENGDYLYYESTSGDVMDYKELMKKHKENKKLVASTCPDNDGDTICDSVSSSTLNMYNIDPDKNPDFFGDAISRMNIISAMRIIKTEYDKAMNDLDFYWDTPEYFSGRIMYQSTMFVNGIYSKDALERLDAMINLIGSWDESAGIYKLRGEVHKSRGENEKAAQDYNIAKQKYEYLLESEDKSVRLYVGYGETLLNLGEKYKAEKYLDKAVGICSKRHYKGNAIPSTYYWWGAALDAKGDSSGAKQKYELGIEKCEEELDKPKYEYQIIDIYGVKYGLYIKLDDESGAQKAFNTMKYNY